MAQQRARKTAYLMALAVCMLVLLGLLFEWFQQQRAFEIVQTQSQTEPSEGTKQEASEKEEEVVRIPVYLVGEVAQPGIYHIEPGTYLYEVVEKAGGLTEAAAKERINMVMRLTDNRQIHIPSREELEENPGLLPGSDEEDQDAPIDLNHADASQLETLPGIGPVTAQAIVDHRQENGPFDAPEDLMQVPGIKEGRFAALEDLIVVSGR